MAAREEGIDDLGFRVAYAEGLGLLGPTLAGKVCDSPTLLHALQTFCRLVNQEASQFWAWIAEGEDELRVHIHRTFEPGVLGYTQTEWIGVIAVVTIVQLFAGPDWQPSRVSLGTRNGVPESAWEKFGNTRFQTRQPEVHVAVPRSILGLSQTEHEGDSRFARPGAPSDTYAGRRPEAEFGGRLMQCLEPHLVDGYPPITLAAEIARTSTRTLQRRLSVLGLTYSGVVDRARFDVASRMLTETDAPSLTIAHATGYSDPSHFARAFRRLTGLSPSQYQSQAGQLQAE